MDKITEILQKYSRFEIITHIRPDADAVGSTRALGFALNSFGKSIRILYPSPPDEILLMTPAPQETLTTTPEYTILVDVSDMDMLGELRPRGKVIVIDHHISNDGFGDVWWVEPGRSSSAEMVYEIILEMGAHIDPLIATNLYMGLFGDTGGFVHPNTTPKVLKMAYDLSLKGASPSAIAERLKKNKSLAHYKIVCLVMKRVVINDGVYASYITNNDLASLGARPEDTSGVVDDIASIAGSRLSILVREVDDKKVHCAIRSRNGKAARMVAEKFNGGGHNLAAGFTIDGRAKDILEEIIQEGLRCINTA